ncbi:hypothetical protein BKA83DRAFT_4426707, partial [Pisolithus microcarpus]
TCYFPHIPIASAPSYIYFPAVFILIDTYKLSPFIHSLRWLDFNPSSHLLVPPHSISLAHLIPVVIFGIILFPFLAAISFFQISLSSSLLFILSRLRG